MSAIVDVELVHLDDCPLWPEAEIRVRAALRAVGLDPTILRDRSVGAVDAPPDFPGSPTILVDGRDPFPNAAPAGPTCRRYPTAGGFDVAPSLDELIAALTR